MRPIRLPGGLLRGEERYRDALLFPLSGRIELALSPQEDEAASLPARVSHAIASAVASIGGKCVTPDLAAELCVADRQFLMHRIAEQLGGALRWVTASCSGCSAKFDFSFELSDLPVREAGTDFPLLRVETEGGPLTFRVPNGRDQEAAVTACDPDARWLLDRCLVEGSRELIAGLGAAGLASCESALEELSPAVLTSVQAECPECGLPQAVPIDPYFILERSAEGILEDVHRLASHYHWTEADILALPTERRRFYLARVDRARGMVS